MAPSRVKLVFNMVEHNVPIATAFDPLLTFVAEHPVAGVCSDCPLSANEVYQRVRGTGADLRTLAQDESDYKALIARASDTKEKLTWAQKLATVRLARGVVPELDACFAALALQESR